MSTTKDLKPVGFRTKICWIIIIIFLSFSYRRKKFHGNRSKKLIHFSLLRNEQVEKSRKQLEGLNQNENSMAVVFSKINRLQRESNITSLEITLKRIWINGNNSGVRWLSSDVRFDCQWKSYSYTQLKLFDGFLLKISMLNIKTFRL